jgi:hypothetical protein
VPDRRDQGEELLEAGGWSPRTRAALACVVLVAAVVLVIGLTRGGSHSSSGLSSVGPSAPNSLRATGSSAPTLSGNDLLVPGLWSRFSDGPASNSHEWSVTVSAELVSVTDRTLSVLYPISVAGFAVGSGVSVAVAELTADRGSGPLGPPPPLSTIDGRTHAALWLQLSVSCGVRRLSFRTGTISIALVGTSEPAVYPLRDLFGSSVIRRPEPC